MLSVLHVENMQIKQKIDKALVKTVGFGVVVFREKSKQGGFDTMGLSDSEMVLCSESFRAVGVTEGWEKDYVGNKHEDKMTTVELMFYEMKPEWLYHQHKFIDTLAELSEV